MVEAQRIGRVLVVDDDEDLRLGIAASLEAESIPHVTVASGEAALEELRAGPFDLVFADIGLPGMTGLELCAWIREELPDTPVVVITAMNELDMAVAALRAGAEDFVAKPFDFQLVTLRARRAINVKRTERELVRLRALLERDDGFSGLIGDSPVMRQIYDLVGRAAATDASVLVTGESGTGKELVARALHERSRRAGQPFVAVNCSAIPEALLESELFGHVKGAFTDARTERKGLFEEADGGTIFLDEFGDLPAVMQAKLLRALEERRIRAVGADRERDVDVRLIAATNKDLEAEVAAGSFREDLYFRINVIHVELPPLRTRGGDVLQLAQAFLARFASSFDKDVRRISAEAAQRMLRHPWPGNVRELRNCMERAVALSTGRTILPSDLPPTIREARPGPPPGSSLSEPTDYVTLAEMERRYVFEVLDAVGGNKTTAARVLGMDRKTLHRRLKRIARDDDADETEET